LIHLSNADVQQVLDMATTLEALRVGYADLERGQATHIPRIDLYAPTGRDDDYYRWGSMTGACRTYGVLAVRIKSDVVYWPDGKTEEKYCIAPGTYSGIILLYSTQNGEPLALINDGYLQHMRVGGGVGIGADLMARPDAQVLGLLGSGGMADTYLQAIALVRKLREVRVYSPTPAHRERFAAEMSDRVRVPIVAVDSAETAIRGADIVASATDALGPTFRAEWLEPGMHVTNVARQEVGQDVIDRADVLMQLGHMTVNAEVPGMGVGVGSMAAYVMGEPHERARIPGGKERPSHPLLFTYGEGRAPSRTSPEQVTVFLNHGTQGLQFAAVAGRVYQLARERGLGQPMPLDWFTQDIRD
jgi:ornithine cyclodeaminase/alanine dehydrogenase-like protein (mu-crystallin family)